MRRTPFLRKPAARTRPERMRAPLTPIRALAPSEPVFCPQPKRDYVRSPALVEAYRLLPCQACGIDDGTVCCAHSNWAIHGKGGGVKADDNRGASLCFRCHGELDQGDADDNEAKQARWWGAHVKSVNKLVLRGLWPKGVPVPETGAYPTQWTAAVEQDTTSIERAPAPEGTVERGQP